MKFNIMSRDEYIELDYIDLVKRYNLSGVYPKIVSTSELKFQVWLSDTARLHELFDSFDDADLTCNYMRSIYYNINGIWNAGG